MEQLIQRIKSKGYRFSGSDYFTKGIQLFQNHFGIFFLSGLVLIAAFMAYEYVTEHIKALVFGADLLSDSSFWVNILISLVGSVISSFVIYPLYMGAAYMAHNKKTKSRRSFDIVFAGYKKLVPIAIISIFFTLVTSLIDLVIGLVGLQSFSGLDLLSDDSLFQFFGSLFGFIGLILVVLLPLYAFLTSAAILAFGIVCFTDTPPSKAISYGFTIALKKAFHFLGFFILMAIFMSVASMIMMMIPFINVVMGILLTIIAIPFASCICYTIFYEIVYKHLDNKEDNTFAPVEDVLDAI